MITPIITYDNPLLQKKKIYKENHCKAGVYMWTHINSGKRYIGSSLNLSQRLVKYFSKACLLYEIKRSNSGIYRAILKYGISSFTFGIMEYCERHNLIEREQFYIDNVKPEYNVLRFAGNRAGFIHKESSKELQRISRLGSKFSEETKLRMSFASVRCVAINITNNTTGEVHEFRTIKEGAKYLNTSKYIVRSYSKTNKLFKGIYSIKRK